MLIFLLSLPVLINWITWQNDLIQSFKRKTILNPDNQPSGFMYIIWKLFNCTLCLSFWLPFIILLTLTSPINAILLSIIISGVSSTYEALNRTL